MFVVAAPAGADSATVVALAPGVFFAGMPVDTSVPVGADLTIVLEFPPGVFFAGVLADAGALFCM